MLILDKANLPQKKKPGPSLVVPTDYNHPPKKAQQLAPPGVMNAQHLQGIFIVSQVMNFFNHTVTLHSIRQHNFEVECGLLIGLLVK